MEAWGSVLVYLLIASFIDLRWLNGLIELGSTAILFIPLLMWAQRDWSREHQIRLSKLTKDRKVKRPRCFVPFSFKFWRLWNDDCAPLVYGEMLSSSSIQTDFRAVLHLSLSRGKADQDTLARVFQQEAHLSENIDPLYRLDFLVADVPDHKSIRTIMATDY